MERSVTVVEAKKNFSDLMARVAYSGDRLVVERHGKPMVAWVSYEDLLRLKRLEKQEMQQRTGQITALTLAEQSRKRIAWERNGVTLPDSADVIENLRKGGVDDLADLR